MIVANLHCCRWLAQRPADLTVVDMGCGEGRLATLVKQVRAGGHSVRAEQRA